MRRLKLKKMEGGGEDKPRNPFANIWEWMPQPAYTPTPLNSVYPDTPLPKLNVNPQTTYQDIIKDQRVDPLKIKIPEPAKKVQNKSVEDDSIHLNYNHIFASNVVQGLGKAISNYLPNSYQNAALRFNQEQFNPLNYLPENPNVSQQALYGDEQFEEGGSFGEGGPNDKGKKKSPEPIVVNNPNDPRLKAYQDSLTVYNFGEKDYQSLKNSGEWDSDSEKSISYKKYVDEYNNGRDNFSWFNNGTNQYMHPETVSKFKGEGLFGFLDYANQARYKKPVQPVVYQGTPNGTNTPNAVGQQLVKKITSVPKPEPKLIRQPYNPELEDAQTQERYIPAPPDLPEIPLQQNQYRVEYQDENMKDVHRDFPSQRMGEEFQALMPGNRTGYHLQNKAMGGYVEGEEYDLSPEEIEYLKAQGYQIEIL